MSSGYLGNQNLKKIGEQIEFTPETLQEYMKCYNDPIYFAKNYIKIVHVDRGFIPFEMYDYQKEIVSKVLKNRRTVTLTARQSGKTTTAVAIILHYILFTEYKTVAILANKGDSAKEVLDRVKIAYEALPKWLQQGVEEWNKFNIVLENGCKIYAGTTSSSAIRGKSISFLYLDECVGANTKCCIEENDSYYYSEITNLINTDEGNFLKVEDKDMLYSIYKVTNKINGKEYIGFHSVKSKKDILCKESTAGSVYRDGYMGSGKLIKSALEKYGPENMCQEIIYLTNDRQDAFDMEKTLVDERYVLREDTYNLSIGGSVCILKGENNGFYGKKHTQETIDKIQSSRKETYSKFPFSWCETFDVKTGTKFSTYREIYNFYNITDSNKTRLSVYKLAHEGVLKYKSTYLQEIAIRRYTERQLRESEADKRHKIKSRMTSERFKGVPKTFESNIKRSESIKRWIDDNPIEHAKKMNKINTNPEKIKKTAEKHTGMKRSEKTRKLISQSKKGAPAHNKNKIYIRNITTGEVMKTDKFDEIPQGWVRGNGIKTGPKNKKAFFNPNENKIKFFIPGEEPEGWRLGRK